MVHAKVHAPMEPPKPEDPIESQISDKALDQVGNPAAKDLVQEEIEVPELLKLPIVPPQPKLVILEQPLPHILPMPRPMPLPDTLPKVPDQPFPFQGLNNPRPLGMRLFGTLPGYDSDMDDEKQPEVIIRQPDKTMYGKFMKMFDEIQDEMILRKHQ